MLPLMVGFEQVPGCAKGAGGGEEVVGRDDAVNEADLQGLVAVDDAGGEHELERAREADRAREEVGAAVAGDEADLDEGRAELRAAGGEPEVAHAREVEAGRPARGLVS